MLRSIASVVAGLVVVTLLTFAIETATTPWLMSTFPDALPTKAAMQGSVPIKLFILFYSTLSMIAAGYVTAWIARRNQISLAIVMATIQVALTAWAMSMFYAHAPPWAWLAGMALMVPAAWVGAVLRVRRRAGKVRVHQG
jgi:hypothetical protein